MRLLAILPLCGLLGCQPDLVGHGVSPPGEEPSSHDELMDAEASGDQVVVIYSLVR